MRLSVLVVASLLALSGCHGKTDPPGSAPTGFTAKGGDGLALLTWDMLPDLTYWIFYEAGSTVAVAKPESTVIRRAIAPRVVAGLVNGTQYAFAVNATHNDSAAGPSTPVMVATPMLAGASWDVGAPQGTQNLKAIAFNGSRFVMVGDAGTIFAGDFYYANTSMNAPSPGVTPKWMTPTSLPVPFTSDLRAAVFSNGYVALGRDGSIISSVDGLGWDPSPSINIAPGTNMNGLAFGVVDNTPTYVAVGDAGQIFTTTDLVTWNQIVVPGLSSDLNSVAVVTGNNVNFVVTGSGGTLLKSSNPAVSWTPLTSNTSSALRGVAYNAPLALYIAVGDSGTIVTSPGPDLITPWTPVVLTPPLAVDLRGVTVGGASASRVLAVGVGGVVAYCDNGCDAGVNWFTASSGASLSKVVFAPGMYLGVGDAGANAVSK